MSDSPDYSQLEDLLFRGFLTERISVEGYPLILKTLNESEKRMILDHTGGAGKNGNSSYFAYALAYSTYMVNGVNILPMRPNIIHQLVDVYGNTNRAALTKMFIKAKTLNETASELLAQVKPYSYGFESEQMWQTTQNLPLTSTSISGVNGTEQIGLNYHQKIWLYLQRMIEIEDQFNRDYDLFAFVASATNPKGTKKAIKKHDKQRQEREEERDQIYEAQNNNPLKERAGQLWVSNESEKDLIEELERSLDGQKDFHDQVVEAYERRAAEGFKKKKQQWEEKRKQKRQETQQLKGPNEQKAIFYDPGQAEEITKSRKAHQKKQLSEGAFESASKFDDQERMLAKWGLIETDRNDLFEDAPSLDQTSKNDGSFYEDTLLEDYMEPVDNDLDKDGD